MTRQPTTTGPGRGLTVVREHSPAPDRPRDPVETYTAQALLGTELIRRLASQPEPLPGVAAPTTTPTHYPKDHDVEDGVHILTAIRAHDRLSRRRLAQQWAVGGGRRAPGAKLIRVSTPPVQAKGGRWASDH